MKLDRDNVLKWMPHDLEEIAKETGALRRRREIKTAEQLLWMALMYSGVVGSLRGTAALGAMTGDFDVNDTSVRYRLQNSVGFLNAILNRLLFGSARALEAQGVRRRICLQDATVVSIPGSKGTDFRLHTEYVPGQGLAYVEITGKKGAERLERGEYKPGDIVIADQGLGHARDIHHVESTGAYSLIRVYLQNLKLEHLDGLRLDVHKTLDQADRGVSSLWVQVPLETSAPVRARLVMTRLPAEQAARARDRLKKRASKRQKGVTDLSSRLAGYVVILTTVPEAELSDREILKTYRVRWQIELFFKRCKSLLGLDELASAGRLAHSWLLGKLIVAALIDRAIFKLQEEFCGTPNKVSENLWRLTKLCFLDLNAAIVAVEGEEPTLNGKARARITEPSRKRCTAAPQIDELYKKLNPSLRKRHAR